MTTQDDTFNSDPLNRPEISPVLSRVLLRKALIGRAAGKVAEANNKMTIGHPESVKQSAQSWAKNWTDRNDPLRMLALVDTELTDKEKRAMNIDTDGELKLEQIVAASDTVTEEKIIDSSDESRDARIARAEAAVARAFAADPYQLLDTDPITETAGITDLNQLVASNEEFGLAA